MTVGSYSVGITNVLATYPVSGGQASITDPEDAAVWDYLCSFLPLEARQNIAEFNLFTDGTSNILAVHLPGAGGRHLRQYPILHQHRLL